MNRNAISSAATGLLTGLLLTIPAAAQPDPIPGFGEVVDVRVVNVEVVVTEKGDRVQGLEADAFELLVDGVKVPIEYFTEVWNGRAVEAGAPGSTSAVPAILPGEAVGTRYLVFIDESFAIPAYRDRALRQLAEQLPLLGADDRMAVVAFDGRRVEMLSSWTRSLQALESALERARERRAYGLQRLAEQRNFDAFERSGLTRSRFASTAFAGRGGFLSLDGFELQRAETLAGQVERVADAATSALRAFARPPGRKAMLLFSGGWPTDPAGWVLGTFEPIADSRVARRDPFAPLVETANRLGYTLYPVDLNRAGRSSLGSAEFGDPLTASLAVDRDVNRDLLEEGTLLDLAAATGGRAFLDGASANALERAVEDTRSYYWLGFTPTWREDDAEHRVEVKLRRKGLKVRSRESFSDLSPSSELTMMVESAQLFELPLPGEQTLGVSFGEPTRAGFRKVLLPVRLAVPLDLVAFHRLDGKLTADLEMRVAATDARGARADIPVVPVRLVGGDGPEAGQVAVFETQLKLRSQPHDLLISLYDPASGNILSKRMAVSL